VRLAACAWQDSNPRAAANPKIGELVGRRQLPAERERSREEWAVGSGGGLEGDGVAEGFELADVVVLAAFGVDAGGVEPGAEVVEAGVWVAQQVPGDHEDGAAGGDDRAFGAAAAGDAPVPFAEEGVSFGGAGGGVAQDGGQVGVAVAGGALAFLLPG